MKTIKSAITYFLLGALPLACTVALIYCGKAVHAPSIVLDALFIVNFFVYVAVSTVATVTVVECAILGRHGNRLEWLDRFAMFGLSFLLAALAVAGFVAWTFCQ